MSLPFFSLLLIHELQSPDEIQLHISTQWTSLNQEQKELLKGACTHALPEGLVLQIILLHLFCEWLSRNVDKYLILPSEAR